MAETELWDAKVPTRERFTTRTLTWDSSFPATGVVGQKFIHTVLKGMYEYDGTNWNSVILSEEENIGLILALT